MDYAKKILGKFGWKDGEGLGKKNDGIATPLKANLKFDHSGLGADQTASDCNNHWWDRVFNEAAQNVELGRDEAGVLRMNLKHQDGVDITTKSYSVKKLKKAQQKQGAVGKGSYANFLKCATLTNTGCEVGDAEKIDAADIAVTQFTRLSDEELFHACGGRTAHKGARHGLKLSGKLARLEKQEQEMLAKIAEKQKSPHCIAVTPGVEANEIKQKQDAESDTGKPSSVFADGEETVLKAKKKSKKHKRKCVEEESITTPSDVPLSKKKKKRDKKDGE